ncbi:MAG TPA: type II toxin-antitoxin system RelE/ParE family toxin [Vicinamibacteria bacterium]
MKPRKGGRHPTGQSRGEASPQQKYRIEIRPAAAEFISSLTGKDLRLVSEKIDALANYPVPPQAKRLQGSPQYLRIRAGNYRVIYSVDNDQVLVVVVTVGHRKDIYDKLRAILRR